MRNQDGVCVRRIAEELLSVSSKPLVNEFSTQLENIAENIIEMSDYDAAYVLNLNCSFVDGE